MTVSYGSVALEANVSDEGDTPGDTTENEEDILPLTFEKTAQLGYGGCPRAVPIINPMLSDFTKLSAQEQF